MTLSIHTSVESAIPPRHESTSPVPGQPSLHDDLTAVRCLDCHGETANLDRGHLGEEGTTWGIVRQADIRAGRDILDDVHSDVWVQSRECFGN